MEEKKWDRLNLRLLYQRLEPQKRVIKYITHSHTCIRIKGENSTKLHQYIVEKLQKLLYDRSVQIGGKPFIAFENSFSSAA